MGGRASRIVASVLSLAIACSAPAQPAAPSGTAASSVVGNPGAGNPGAITVPLGAPATDAVSKAEADLKRVGREQAGLDKLGPGAIEFASYLDRTASFLISQTPGKVAGSRPGGRLAARLAGVPPPGAAIAGVYAMTSYVFDQMVADQPSYILSETAKTDTSSKTKSGTTDPTTDQVTVEGHKGSITTQFSFTASKIGSKISLELKMTQQGEVRDSTTGVVLYKISSEATGHAEGDFCPDASGIARATMTFTGREDHFDSKGTKTGSVEHSFGAQIRFRADENAKLVSTDLTPNGALGEFVMQFAAQAAAGPYEQAWRSGACIEIVVDPNGGDVDQGSETTVTAKLRHRTEGNDLDKTVEAKLTSGVKSIEPSGQKQKSPATFKYKAGSEPADKGGVSFDSTSNRGIGHTGVTFTVGNGWLVNATGTSDETFQGGVITSELTVTIKDLKIKADKDGKLTGEGTMQIRGAVTSGQGICKGQLDQTLPVKATGSVVGTGNDALLNVTLNTASPPGVTVNLTCTIPYTGATITQPVAAEGFADRWGEALGPVELPANGGNKRARHTYSPGGVATVVAVGEFTVVRTKV
jgi:hypothetical protein